MSDTGIFVTLLVITASVLALLVHADRYKKWQVRIRCPRCKNEMSIWGLKPKREEVVNRGEIYTKQIEVETGFTETRNDGVLWDTNLDDVSVYTGRSKSHHYEYREVKHQMLQYRYIFDCIECRAEIGIRKWKEERIE